MASRSPSPGWIGQFHVSSWRGLEVSAGTWTKEMTVHSPSKVSSGSFIILEISAALRSSGVSTKTPCKWTYLWQNFCCYCWDGEFGRVLFRFQNQSSHHYILFGELFHRNNSVSLTRSRSQVVRSAVVMSSSFSSAMRVYVCCIGRYVDSRMVRALETTNGRRYRYSVSNDLPYWSVGTYN